MPEVVRLVCEDGPCHLSIGRLGVRFDRNEGETLISAGKGHSQRRVLHAGDITGAEIGRALVAAVRAHKNVTVLEGHHAIDLLTTRKHLHGLTDECLGAYVLDVAADTVKTIAAKAVVLATGGSGKVYRYTSNPNVATGDGVAMAYRAGAKVGNLEFFQFHPTCLFHPMANSFLISEALRGEGGTLRSVEGVPFMDSVHPLGSLAPRDVVARAIDAELKRSGQKFVYLDMTHLDAAFLEERFPSIFAKCIELGIDMRTMPIPVVPAAHYQCGGVISDEWAQTSIARLFAIGEVACTGLHGANRLASNSLLEGRCLRIEPKPLKNLLSRAFPDFETLPQWQTFQARPADEAVVIAHNWNEVRHLMWNYVGIVRSDRRLARARRRIELLSEEIHEYYWNYHITPDLLELRNIVLVAELIIRSALRRKESRGLHFNTDYSSAPSGPAVSPTILEGL